MELKWKKKYLYHFFEIFYINFFLYYLYLKMIKFKYIFHQFKGYNYKYDSFFLLKKNYSGHNKDLTDF
jgi:hypothetical protein